MQLLKVQKYPGKLNSISLYPPKTALKIFNLLIFNKYISKQKQKQKTKQYTYIKINLQSWKS